jgi:hypothetical protein
MSRIGNSRTVFFILGFVIFIGMDFTRFCRHKSTSGLKLFERKRAHLVKMTVDLVKKMDNGYF